MSSVTEWIVREYFEQRGYLVSQPRKYIGPGSHQPGREEPDLLVWNPAIRRAAMPGGILWEGSDLRGIPAALIGIRGWHTERFSATRLAALPDLLRFAAAEVLTESTRRLGGMQPVKILCLPKLPSSTARRDEALTLLSSRGIDGVILFRTVLEELIRMTDASRNYEKSDLLQILRLLKTHDLVGGGQMDLFARRRRRRAATATTSPPEKESS